MKNLLRSRREVLQTLGAPLVISSTALGNAGTPPASERVALGHIGVGNEGGYLFHAFQGCKGLQSVAIADAYKDRREAYARTIKGKAYGDFRELLARSDIDAVIVATPDHWHVPIAIAAARAKKDAYVEKPLGVTIEQDLACGKEFARAGRIFQYGTQQRSSAIAASAASWSAAGGSASCTRSRSWPPTAERAARPRWCPSRPISTTTYGAAPRR